MSKKQADAYGIPHHLDQYGKITLLILILTSWSWFKPFMLFLCDIMREVQA